MGEWIEKTEPPHYCQQPDPGDHYEMEFGNHSKWRCDCGRVWVWYEFGSGWTSGPCWILVEQHELNLQRRRDYEAKIKADQEDSSAVTAARITRREPWWKKLVTPRDGKL
jgi:hypothetical protein